MKNRKNHPLRFLFIALLVATALCITGCSGKTADNAPPLTEIQTDGQSFGTGATAFSLTVVDAEGGEIHAEIHTDRKVVGEALQELGLIGGEESPTGLYVKTVNGIMLDYDKDGAYWAFYVNDEYAQTGVDSTEIVEGYSYAFKAEQS